MSWLPGVYAVVLTVEDKAGNSQAARRFVIFDNTNTISINTGADKQLRVNSAAENTSYTWLTTLRESDNAGVKVSVGCGDIVWLSTTDSHILRFIHSYSSCMADETLRVKQYMIHPH